MDLGVMDESFHPTGRSDVDDNDDQDDPGSASPNHRARSGGGGNANRMDGMEEPLSATEYDIVPDPKADAIDLSDLRGVANQQLQQQQQQQQQQHHKQKQQRTRESHFKKGIPHINDEDDNNSENELENLAEILPDIKARRRVSSDAVVGLKAGAMSTDNVVLPNETGKEDVEVIADAAGGHHHHSHLHPNRHYGTGPMKGDRKFSMKSAGADSTAARRMSPEPINMRTDSLHVTRSKDVGVDESPRGYRNRDSYGATAGGGDYRVGGEDGSSGRHADDTTFDDYPESERAVEEVEDESKIPKEFMNMSSVQSISTATQTHEVRMPMYLPTFKPATGCTNASDFIVRCFVARLRSGITVVKHGRSRWCKSRLRVLHIHPDGRSLSWKPAEGEPSSSKRPPKLDLSTCMEVRHAWSPDPQNPMYTGTPILRQKCEAANAHKSFALIFKHRTVDVTAVTADQCKVLMEGFSALCFRLQVANLAGRGASKKGGVNGGISKPMPDEDGVSLTASATLTNTSTPRGVSGR